MKRIGKAAITWTSTEDTPIIERVHQLRVPLFDARPSHTMQTYGGQSLDGSVRETFTIESGANDLTATVRMDDNPQSLIDLIKAGSRNTTLVYYPNLQDSDTSYSVKLISPLTPAEVGLDGQTGNRGGRSIELRFRQTDQSAFRAEAFQGSNVLFRWKAGDELSGATFTRADTAVRTLKGWGTLSNTTNGRPRIEWVSTEGTTGYRDTPSLLLEGARTNYIADSEDLSSTDSWNIGSSAYATLTSAQSDPYGGTAAWLFEHATTDSGVSLDALCSLSTNIYPAPSIFFKQSDSTNVRLFLITVSGTKFQATVDWSSGVPDVTMSSGVHDFTEKYIGGWYRFGFHATGFYGGAYTLRTYPTVGTATGGVYVFGAQLEGQTT